MFIPFNLTCSSCLEQYKLIIINDHSLRFTKALCQLQKRIKTRSACSSSAYPLFYQLFYTLYTLQYRTIISWLVNLPPWLIKPCPDHKAIYFWGSPGLGEGVGWLAINPLVSKGPSFMKLQFVQCLLGLKLAHGRALRPWHQETKHAKTPQKNERMGLKNAVVDDITRLWEMFACSRKMMCCMFLAILIHGFSHIEIHAALIASCHRDSYWPNTALLMSWDT